MWRQRAIACQLAYVVIAGLLILCISERGSLMQNAVLFALIRHVQRSTIDSVLLLRRIQLSENPI